MNKMTISIIYATDENDVLGVNGKMGWYVPEDMRYFKAVTLGEVCIMGRKTYESLPSVLPGRVNIVLSRDPDFAASFSVTRSKNVYIVPKMSIAVYISKSYFPNREIFIIGGAQVYKHALKYFPVSFIYKTIIRKKAVISSDDNVVYFRPSHKKFDLLERIKTKKCIFELYAR